MNKRRPIFILQVFLFYIQIKAENRCDTENSQKKTCCSGYTFDEVSKTCIECRIGYQGQNCNSPCPSGYFGEKCQMVCSCPNDICNNIKGCIFVKEQGLTTESYISSSADDDLINISSVIRSTTFFFEKKEKEKVQNEIIFLKNPIFLTIIVLVVIFVILCTVYIRISFLRSTGSSLV